MTMPSYLHDLPHSRWTLKGAVNGLLFQRSTKNFGTMNLFVLKLLGQHLKLPQVFRVMYLNYPRKLEQ